MAQSERNYEVGYGKPPKKSQFKPGQSGNPKGRSKKTKDLQKLFERELSKTLRVSENGRPTTVTIREAFVKSVINAALKGERDARRLLFAVIEKQPDLDGFEINTTAEAMLQDILNQQSSNQRGDDGSKF